MSDAEWLSVFGAIAGFIGAISGLVGAVLGYRGYRQAHKVKALDLRLELRKTEVDARTVLDELPGLLERANSSRIDVLMDRGFGPGSTLMTAWTTRWNADWKTVTSLEDGLSASDHVHVAMNDHRALELRLVSIHGLIGRANQLRTKYEAVLAQDEGARKHRVRL